MGHRIAMDVGQSSTVVRIAADSGRKETRYRGVLTDQPLLRQWARTLHDFHADNPDVQPDAVAIASSGLGNETAAQLLPLVHDLGVRRIVLAHDSVSNYLGALGDRHGAMVAAGTGTIGFAVGPTGVARVDGWGSLLGDAGSAYWIGRTALDAALRGYDGRGPTTQLTDMMRRDFPNLDQAYLTIQADPNRVARIAGYATEVHDLAASDATARRILISAAEHLVDTAATGLRRTGLDQEPHPIVAAMGGVLESDVVRDHFAATLTQRWPGIAIVSAAGTALDGAMLMHSLPPEHALRPFITQAER